MPLIVAGTESMTLPVGTTAQRPSTPTTGMYRFNSTLGNNEVYNGTFWETDGIVQGTSVASTSGTSIDFTGIPAGVKRITVMFAGVSLSGTANLLVQLGTGATPTWTTSGYVSSCAIAGGTSAATSTSGFLSSSGASATDTASGNLIINNISTNTWVESGNLTRADKISCSGGYVALGAVLTAIRITTTGTDTFDAGSVNILYEF